MSGGWHGTIVCGVDETPAARDALRAAVALARRLAWRIVLVHVRRRPHPPGGGTPDDGRREPHARALAEADALVRRLAAEVGCDPAVGLRGAVGDPAACLVACADEERADLVVVGSRARGPLRTALFGSVSAELCRRAPCPVLVVASTREALVEIGLPAGEEQPAPGAWTMRARALGRDRRRPTAAGRCGEGRARAATGGREAAAVAGRGRCGG